MVVPIKLVTMAILVALAALTVASAARADTPPAESISGTITAAGGGPLEGAVVCEYDSGGISDGCYGSNSQGEYVIPNLAPGQYKIEFRSPSTGNYLTQYYNGQDFIWEADPVTTFADHGTTGIDAVLQPAAEISGTVTDADGHPLAGARACASGFAGSGPGECAYTDTEGNYTITDLREGSYQVEFTGPSGGSYLPQYYDHTESMDDATPVEAHAGSEVPGIDAALEEAAYISGTVRDEADDPIADVYVCVSGVGTFYVGCGVTDGSGEYTIGSLPDGTYTVEFQNPVGGNYITQFYDGQASQASATHVDVSVGHPATGIDATMHEGGSISGTVTAGGSGPEAGSPLESATACARIAGSTDYGSCVSTNGAGEYTIGGLTAGDYIVEFRAPYGLSYVSQFYDDAATAAAATTVPVGTGGQATGIDATLEPGAKIGGHVTDAEGTDVAGLSVCAFRASASSIVGCASTDADGNYSILGLAPGSYRLWFQASAPYLQQYYDGKASLEAADPISLAEGASATADAVLHEGGKISGTVTGAGAGPLEDVEVCAERVGSYGYECAWTDDAGEYTIEGLEPGRYRVEFTAPDGTNYERQYYDDQASIGAADKVGVQADTTTSGIDATLREGVEINGTVSADEAGSPPLEDAEICAYAEGSGELGGCAYSGSDGDYSLDGLSPGSYKVLFEPPYHSNYLPQYYGDAPGFAGGTTVTLQHAGEVEAAVDAALHPGGAVSGHVGDLDSDPVEDVEVCATRLRASDDTCGYTDSDGDYSIGGLREGKYTVVFYPEYDSGYQTQYFDGAATFEDAEPVEVELGHTRENVNAKLSQTPQGGVIEGTVRDTEGDPIAGASVCARNANIDPIGSCVATEADGTYSIDGLPAAAYTVAFNGGLGQNYLPRYYDESASAGGAKEIHLAAGGTETGIDAVLSPGGRITGAVSAEGGEALPYSSVCAFSVSSGESGCSITDEAGRYVIGGLAEGTYKVQVSPPFGTDLIAQWFDGKASSEDAQIVSVTLGATRKDVNAELSAGGRILGNVSDAGGEPIAGVVACAHPVDDSLGGFGNCAGTDDEGNYAISGLATGDYVVAFSSPSGCGGGSCASGNYATRFYDEKDLRGEAEPLHVDAGQGRSGVDAVMRAGGVIAGHVSGEDGERLEGVYVCAVEVGGEYEENCDITNVAGAYTVEGLGVGNYVLEFSPPSESEYLTQYYDGKQRFEEATELVMGEGDIRQGIDATLDLGGSIEGQVAVTGGAALPRATVCAYEAGAMEPARCTTADGHGDYLLNGLAAGGYDVEFSAPVNCFSGPCTAENYVRQFYDGAASRAGATQVQVVAGQPSEGVDATLAVGGEIGGTVTGPDDEPAYAVEVCAYPAAGGEVQACAEPGEGGKYVIAGLSAGDYKVEFAPASECGGCGTAPYEVQYYDDEPTMAAADPVTVTVGHLTGGINAKMAESTAALPPANETPPQLAGTPAVGQTLTCADGTWSGSPTHFTYSWKRGGSQIAGQTSSTYRVTEADAGQAITCAVSAENAAGATSATSNALSVPAKPANTVTPSISGTPAVGETLTCAPGTWSGSPQFAYAWLRDSTVLTGEADSTYEVDSGDAGHGIACEVTASNDGGVTAATSASVSIPAAAGAPANETPPQLTGTPAGGQTLSCADGTWSGSPTHFEYSWNRGDSPISGQTSSTYKVTEADAGSALTCVVIAENASGSARATSNALDVPAKPVNNVAPSISGTPAVGETLTCDPGTWTGSPQFAYAWLRGGTGALVGDSAEHTVRAADAGHSLSCRVTATNGGGTTVATSAAITVPAAEEEEGHEEAEEPTHEEPAGEDTGSQPHQGSPVNPGGNAGAAPQPAVPPPPPAPDRSHSAGVGTAARTARVKGGKAMITLTCARGTCAGKLVLVVKSKGKKVVIGSVRYRVPAGKKKTLRVKLSGKGKALLRHAGHRGLRVQLKGTGIKARAVVLKGR